MDSWNIVRFKNDLSIFIDKIIEYNVPGSFKDELDKVMEQLNSKSLVDYNLKDLCLYVSGIKGSIPTSANHLKIYLDNLLKFKDNYSVDVDPLFKYKFEINVHAYNNDQYEGSCYKSSWHLDQHTPSDADIYTHPSYHFQFGGKKIKTLSSGDLHMLSAPRIPHPPMDIFLGIHFILANYFDNTTHTFVKELLADYEYEEIIKRAQERLWTPYFKGFDSNNIHHDFTIKKMFPLYIN